MHEDVLVQALWARVEAQTQVYRPAAIARVHLQVGELTGVEAHRFAEAYARAPRPKLGQLAELDVKVVPATWECRRCHRPFSRGERLQCQGCGQPAVLTRGDELAVSRIELEVADALGDHMLVSNEVHQSLLAEDAEQGRRLRQQFEDARVLVVNLIGTTQAGKAALLEATTRVPATPALRLAALLAGVDREEDARRLRAVGVEAAPVAPANGCHLDAATVQGGLASLRWTDADVLFLDNAATLGCPPLYDLGQTATALLVPVTESEALPLLHTSSFHGADVVLVTKMDLVADADMRLDRFEDALARVMARPRVLTVCARTGQGLAAWVAWLGERLAALRELEAAEAGEAAALPPKAPAVARPRAH